MNAGMLTEELLDLLSFVRREVVGDHVDFFALGLVGNDVGEEGHELGRRVARGGLAKHFAGLGVERRVQRQRAMAVVLKAWRSARPGDSGSTGSLRSRA